MEVSKSGTGHELSPGAKRLISTHIKQKPRLLLEKYAFKQKERSQFSFKDNLNHQPQTKPQKSSLRSSKSNKNNKTYQIEKYPINTYNKKNSLQEKSEDENILLPISNIFKNDNDLFLPDEQCQVNDTNIVKELQVIKNAEKFPNSNLSHDEREQTSFTSGKYEIENKEQLLDNLQIREEKNCFNNENKQKNIQIKELSKELKTVRSAWHDDKEKLQNKIKELEEKLKEKDKEIQVLQGQLNQEQKIVSEEITNLQPHTKQFSEIQSKETQDSSISDKSKKLNFDSGNLYNLYDNAEDKKNQNINCNVALKRKYFEMKNDINGRQKRQNILNSSTVHHQAAKELTPPLTPKSFQKLIGNQSDNPDTSLKINRNVKEKCSEDNKKKSPVKLSSIVFDLETNDLKGNYCSVIQISAIDVSDTSSDIFNAYICPNSEFDPNASIVNGFYMKSGKLYKNGKEIGTVTETKAITCFLDWLKKRKSKCILIAHDSTTFKVPCLLDLFKKHNLFNYFKNLVHGFLDTLKLFKSIYPSMDKYTQPHLVKVILDLDYKAHDGIENVIVLAKLITFNTISVESIINYIDHTPLGINFYDRLIKYSYENEVDLKPLHTPLVTNEEISLNINSIISTKIDPKFPRELPENVMVTNEINSQSKLFDNDNEEHVMVAFDLETTGLDRYYHEIVQISAVEVNDLSARFNIYILPKHDFDPEASKVNGLHLLNGHLCKNYYKLETVSEIEAINAFVTWLSKRKKKCLFFAHNGKNFDIPRIRDSCRKGDVFELFKSYVIGYVDTLQLFKTLHPRRSKYTQTSLVKDLLHLKYNAHDGLEDVLALAKLLKHKSVYNEAIFSHLSSI